MFCSNNTEGLDSEASSRIGARSSCLWSCCLPLQPEAFWFSALVNQGKLNCQLDHEHTWGTITFVRAVLCLTLFPGIGARIHIVPARTGGTWSAQGPTGHPWLRCIAFWNTPVYWTASSVLWSIWIGTNIYTHLNWQTCRKQMLMLMMLLGL